MALEIAYDKEGDEIKTEMDYKNENKNISSWQ